MEETVRAQQRVKEEEGALGIVSKDINQIS